MTADARDLSKLERIHSGSRHVLYRDEALVLKLNVDASSASAAASLRHEYELLRNLDLAGVVRARGLVDSAGQLALAMEDAGETNLATRLESGALDVTAFLEVACQLAEAVARLHDARIVHRDIQPGNIVWDSALVRATLCDFAIASTSPTLVFESPNPNQLEGALPYMSPEQTGRTRRTVDWRADLYSLGATYYEMLTGAPPFAERDDVALAHALIARPARPPHEIDARVPLTLSRIVLRLLEKEPERRYQTAEALAADLREARKQWLQSASIASFSLASREVPRGLSIPDELYGRDEELRSLGDALAAVRAGGRRLVLVTGAPGIGKSALVDRLRQSVSEGRGHYAAGKFDQLQRSVPYSGLAQALRSLVRQLLTEPEADLEIWRQRLEDAVAPNGQLLLPIVPELERILGPQSVVPEVSLVEAKNRFHLVLTRFLRAFAQAGQPFVLFLDDLQWVDAASLQLLEQYVGDAASHHLLVIGAYRDNEVGPSHALTLALARLQDAGCEIQTIHLNPLSVSAIAQLAADTFDVDATKLKFLADLVLRKSAGNPFFVRRLLHSMYAQGLFRYDAGARKWSWNESEIERAPISDNVLDLMVLAIGRLPSHTKRLLEIGACIGYRFEQGTLADLTELSPATVMDQLRPALEDGLLVRVVDAEATLQFAHDRVQQAAYGLLDEDGRRALHHAIGRRLLARVGHDRDASLFDIVDQFALGEARVEGGKERDALIELNLAAGRKAKAAAAYRAAFEYLTAAKRLLGAAGWEERLELTFVVHRELAESAYLAGEHATAEGVVEESLAHAPTKVAKAELYSLRVLAATVVSDWARALHWGREGLSVFGQAWPLEGLAEAIEAEAAAVMKNVGDRNLEDLAGEPEVEDADIRASMHLLSILGAPAYFSGSSVLLFLVSRAANLSLEHGPSPYSPFSFVLFGGIHNARTGQYDIGYSFGKLALAMAQRFGNRAEECRTIEVFGVLVHSWKAPMRDSLPLLKEGFRAGVESGETAFAAFNLNSVLINALPSGMPLNELLAEADVALDFAVTQKNRASVEIALPQRQIARALTGATTSPDVFDDQDFSEAKFLEEAGSHQTALGHYWVAKLQMAYLMGDYARASKFSEEAAKRIPTGILGMITSAEHVFYTALTMAATATATTDLGELRALHQKLVVWAEYCPANFAHKVSLVGAEIARLDRMFGDPSTLYRAAIQEAERERFVQNEALAHELRARFLLGEHEPEFAAVHARLSRDRYRRWGATVKIAALERALPECFRSESPATRRGASIDEMALIKASQAISMETAPERLFERILRVVVEVAGAQRGTLVLAQGGELMVHARIEAADEASVSVGEVPLEQCIDLPSAICRYVLRTREFLLLPDASASGMFARDPVVQRRRVRSVLCVPLVKQSALVGLIYLENNAMAGAFAEDLLEVGQVLASQAVISLENSTLLRKLQALTGALEERVADRTQRLTDQIAARDKAETALRVTETRQALLLELSDALRTLRDPDAIKQTAMRLLGAHLGVARAYYFHVERDADGAWIQRIEPGYARDPALPEFAGAHELEPFGREMLESFALGEVVAVEDVAAAPGMTNEQRDVFRAARVAAFVNVPLQRDGTYIAGIGAHDTVARAWTDNELELIREVAARTWTASERARAEAALREADQQKDEFLAMLAHELRNPLASITSASELLARTVTTDARSEGVLALLKRQSKQLTRLVDDLLDLSRIARGRITLEETPVEVGELIDQAVETVQALIREKEQRFFVAKAAHSIYVRGDRARLVQAISNVVHNAVKYTDAGGEIRLDILDSPHDVTVRVKDNGTGIPPELLPHLFDLFVQSERTLDRSQGGLGIGLSVVKRLIEMHRGSVEAESPGVGRGSTFTIRLPRIAQPQAPSPVQSKIPTTPRRILVVDDNVDAADMLAMLLELDGHEVHAVYGASEALDAVSRLKPEIMFLDIGLPVMDGYEVARRLRAHRENECLRIIALTGYGQEEDRRRSTEAGFNSHLVKPVTPEALQKVLT